MDRRTLLTSIGATLLASPLRAQEAPSWSSPVLDMHWHMRRTPEVIFLLDRGIEKGTTVLGLINKLGAERLEKGEVPPGSDVLPELDPDAADGDAAEGATPAEPSADDDD